MCLMICMYRRTRISATNGPVPSFPLAIFLLCCVFLLFDGQVYNEEPWPRSLFRVEIDVRRTASVQSLKYFHLSFSSKKQTTALRQEKLAARLSRDDTHTLKKIKNNKIQRKDTKTPTKKIPSCRFVNEFECNKETAKHKKEIEQISFLQLESLLRCYPSMSQRLSKSDFDFNSNQWTWQE